MKITRNILEDYTDEEVLDMFNVAIKQIRREVFWMFKKKQKIYPHMDGLEMLVDEMRIRLGYELK